MSDTIIRRPPPHEFRLGEQWVYPSGKKVNAFDLRMADVSIDDIAHSLSMQCRYNGHLPFFYSVAEHSVLVSREMNRIMRESANRAATATEKMAGLLHDAAETYFGDLVSPVKHAAPRLREAEHEAIQTIFARFGIEWDDLLWQRTMRADRAVFEKEWADTRFGVARTPDKAQRMFLAEYAELARARGLGR